MIEIEMFPIAKTALNKMEVEKWLQHIGAEDYTDWKELEDDEALVGLAARRCYKSFKPGLNPNVTAIRRNWVSFFDNIKASGHGSVLEHATWTWAIEGVSRVFTGELNRHRAGCAISEGSMRYIRFDKLDYWLPPSIRESIVDDFVKARLRYAFQHVFDMVEKEYKALCASINFDNLPFIAKKEFTSLFRRLIPMGIATGGIWTFNLRALRHIMATRCSAAAEEEICYVFSEIGKVMVEECLLFNDFNYQTGFWVPEYKKI